MDEAPPPQRDAELALRRAVGSTGIGTASSSRCGWRPVMAGGPRRTDRRLEAALTARTYGEVAGLTTALPAHTRFRPGPTGPGAEGPGPHRLPWQQREA